MVLQAHKHALQLRCRRFEVEDIYSDKLPIRHSRYNDLFPHDASKLA